MIYDCTFTFLNKLIRTYKKKKTLDINDFVSSNDDMDVKKLGG